jgi:ectoine hydroxylase-related dioxygenase (phytanoyl-CoA dioxygenase family)
MIPDRFAPLADRRDAPLRPLLEQGYCIMHAAATSGAVQAMSRGLDDRFERTPFCIGDFHGARTKRFHRLLARARAAPELAIHEPIMAAVNALLGLWCDFPELNLAQGVEIHPGAPAQIPHRDQGMWPLPKGSMELSVNVFWPMTEFTADNGATRVWPGSHLRPDDPPLGEPLVCEMAPGDALLVLGSTVHAAGANRTATPRRAAIFSYCVGWLKAYENQSLAYSREEVRSFPPALAPLLGYRWHRPNLGTYDGQCPSLLLAGEPDEHLATIDALAPHHEPLVAAFAARQRSDASVGPVDAAA